MKIMAIHSATSDAAAAAFQVAHFKSQFRGGTKPGIVVQVVVLLPLEMKPLHTSLHLALLPSVFVPHDGTLPQKCHIFSRKLAFII
jgi:hypothetical protein